MRYRRHPLLLLFGAATFGVQEGMEWLSENGFISDNWEEIPRPEQIPAQEVVRILEAAKRRFDPAWCDQLIDLMEQIELDRL